MLSWRNNASKFDFGAPTQDGYTTCIRLSSHSASVNWLDLVYWWSFRTLFSTLLSCSSNQFSCLCRHDVRRFLTPLNISDISERNRHFLSYKVYYVHSAWSLKENWILIFHTRHSSLVIIIMFFMVDWFSKIDTTWSCTSFLKRINLIINNMIPTLFVYYSTVRSDRIKAFKRHISLIFGCKQKQPWSPSCSKLPH